MRWSGDYTSDMGTGNLTDDRVENLLTGRGHDEDHPELEAFVAALRTETLPPRDIDQMATALAATARSSARANPRRVTRRLALLAVAGALLMTMAGVAVAADGSAPGDLLYNVDRTLEQMGIGDGGMTERIEEFDDLVSKGKDDEAFAMLSEAIDESDGAMSAKAQHHLETAAKKASPNATIAQITVAEKKQWIEENKGNGSGADGSDFGQGVAEIARSGDDAVGDGEKNSQPASAGPKEQKEPGPPAHAGPKDDVPATSNSSPGAGTESTTQPPSKGSQGEKDPGPPAHAGPKKEKEKDPGSSASAGSKKEKDTGSPSGAGSKKDD